MDGSIVIIENIDRVLKEKSNDESILKISDMMNDYAKEKLGFSNDATEPEKSEDRTWE